MLLFVLRIAELYTLQFPYMHVVFATKITYIAEDIMMVTFTRSL